MLFQFRYAFQFFFFKVKIRLMIHNSMKRNREKLKKSGYHTTTQINKDGNKNQQIKRQKRQSLRIKVNFKVKIIFYHHFLFLIKFILAINVIYVGAYTTPTLEDSLLAYFGPAIPGIVLRPVPPPHIWLSKTKFREAGSCNLKTFFSSNYFSGLNVPMGIFNNFIK